MPRPFRLSRRRRRSPSWARQHPSRFAGATPTMPCCRRAGCPGGGRWETRTRGQSQAPPTCRSWRRSLEDCLSEAWWWTAWSCSSRMWNMWSLFLSLIKHVSLSEHSASCCLCVEMTPVNVTNWTWGVREMFALPSVGQQREPFLHPSQEEEEAPLLLFLLRAECDALTVSGGSPSSWWVMTSEAEQHIDYRSEQQDSRCCISCSWSERWREAAGKKQIHCRSWRSEVRVRRSIVYYCWETLAGVWIIAATFSDQMFNLFTFL